MNKGQSERVCVGLREYDSAPIYADGRMIGRISHLNEKKLLFHWYNNLRAIYGSNSAIPARLENVQRKAEEKNLTLSEILSEFNQEIGEQK